MIDWGYGAQEDSAQQPGTGVFFNIPQREVEMRAILNWGHRDDHLRPTRYRLVAVIILATTGPAVARATEVESVDGESSQEAVKALRAYVRAAAADRKPIDKQTFATVSLTRQDAERVCGMLWKDHVSRVREQRAAEMEARELSDGDLRMPFYYKIFGEKPIEGRSLYISMHGGGGAPARVNDRQWENQKKLYQLKEGVYVAPRAPTNTWNLWHQAHIDRLFDRLIQNLIVFEDVDPDRIYIMGYSAGGDGVFQLAPRMADRLAAAAMMAGHPNETSPLGLRNLPFALHMGGKDGAYRRNEVARQWETKLAELQKSDPDGYVHWVKIYPEKRHWMDGEDAAAIPWMAKYKRRRLPRRIVWKQDDVRHARFYWLAVDPETIEGRAEVIANREGANIDVRATGVKQLTALLNDQMLPLDQPITITSHGTTLFAGPVNRSIKVIARTLAERGDPRDVFFGDVTVELEE